jgi:hypothetical protein
LASDEVAERVGFRVKEDQHWNPNEYIALVLPF